jgi:uncharacterized protein
MAHISTKKFSYGSQFGILIGLICAGFLVGGVLSILPVLDKINFKSFNTDGLMDSLLKPENANALRLMQLISTLFMMGLPAFFYAKICHIKPYTHLGFMQKPMLQQLGLVVLIMLACLPVIALLQELTNMIPFSAATLAKFKAAEDSYNAQMAVMARMNGVGDYIISMFMIAFLPAVFEEMIFRGALQNLLSRWTKKPILSIIITAAIFSMVHGSYIGFFPRFVLGFVLGWFFYRTGNIWLNIFGHFINNAIGVTAIYILSLSGKPVDLNKMNDKFPLAIGLLGVAALIGLLIYFDKISKEDKPGQEVKLAGYINENNPFIDDLGNNDNLHS